jgi:co-chaperonin GroES (HSP10)
MVLCKRLTRNVDDPVRGIYYPKNFHQNQNLYQNADRVYEVIKIPEEITEEKSWWMTDVEVKPGDLVWVKPVDALNAPEVFDEEGNEYRLLKYFSLIVARRKKAVIPLNGNILMTNVYSRKLAVEGLVLVQKARIEVGLAKVEYVGTPNRYYCHKKKLDLDAGINIQPGQIIILDVFNKNTDIISRKYLEEEMFARFDPGKNYFYDQRRSIHGILLDKYQFIQN